jgi:hypothetical protein
MANYGKTSGGFSSIAQNIFGSFGYFNLIYIYEIINVIFTPTIAQDVYQFLIKYINM